MTEFDHDDDGVNIERVSDEVFEVVDVDADVLLVLVVK